VPSAGTSVAATIVGVATSSTDDALHAEANRNMMTTNAAALRNPISLYINYSQCN